jgi:serine/threonine-protein kinase
LGRAYLEKKMYSESIEALQRSIALSGDSPDEPVDLARAYARSGNKREAATLLDGLLRSSQSRYLSPTTIGSVYAALGERDKAFEWFNKAIAERDYILVLIRVDPMFDDVRDDPRFPALVKQVGF